MICYKVHWLGLVKALNMFMYLFSHAALGKIMFKFEVDNDNYVTDQFCLFCLLVVPTVVMVTE